MFGSLINNPEKLTGKIIPYGRDGKKTGLKGQKYLKRWERGEMGGMGIMELWEGKEQGKSHDFPCSRYVVILPVNICVNKQWIC